LNKAAPGSGQLRALALAQSPKGGTVTLEEMLISEDGYSHFPVAIEEEDV
jgi:hypothetical protein